MTKRGKKTSRGRYKQERKLHQSKKRSKLSGKVHSMEMSRIRKGYKK
jgi:hypothetical protein